MAKAAVAQPVPHAPVEVLYLEDEMQRSYLDYAMSTIVARALPSAYDGLKPVHRRILYGMMEGNFRSDGPFRKSARIVGDVMGKYHPHGDSSIYDAMVRMAQPFSMSIPLIDGQGNFGSVDGDPPAAMRYTEARLSRLADTSMVADIHEGTVDWQPNYDGSEVEPTVLPTRYPNLLVNGGFGIAVGFANRFLTHNLAEAVDATLAVIDRPDLGLDELLKIMPGPDFPTGGVILGRNGCRVAAHYGRGPVVVSSLYEIEELKGGREAIIVTELPFEVNKATLLEHIAKLVRDKAIEGISDLRDESDNNVRIVIELKREATPKVVVTALANQTLFEKTFTANNRCIDSNGSPVIMGTLELIREFVAFRRETINRRTNFRIDKVRRQLDTRIGLFCARGEVDEVVRRIRASSDRDFARLSIMEMVFPVHGALATILEALDPDAEPQGSIRLSEAQANAVLDLRISQLTALEQDKIAAEALTMLANVTELATILNDPRVLDGVMKTELLEIKAKFGTPRQTKFGAPRDASSDYDYEDKPVVLTMTKKNYVKLTPLATFREQARGGKGKTGAKTGEDDFVILTLVCSLRSNLFVFTTRGITHVIKAYELPEGGPATKGMPIQNFLELEAGEGVATIMPVPVSDTGAPRYMMFVTDKGDVRRNSVSDFASVSKAGKIAMKLDGAGGIPAAKLIAVLECTEDDDIVLATRKGKAARFQASAIRVFKGRESTGNKGIKLQEGDSVLSAAILRHFEVTPQERAAYFAGGTHNWVDPTSKAQVTLTLPPERMEEMRAAEQTMLTVTAEGFGKQFSTLELGVTGRDVQGVKVGDISATTGDLVACFPVVSADGLILVTTGGQAIRIRAEDIRVFKGREARGVRVFDLPEGDTIADVARIPSGDDGSLDAPPTIELDPGPGPEPVFDEPDEDEDEDARSSGGDDEDED